MTVRQIGARVRSRWSRAEQFNRFRLEHAHDPERGRLLVDWTIYKMNLPRGQEALSFEAWRATNVT